MPKRALPVETKERNINGLTAREQSFCDEYLKTGSTLKAALSLGYSQSSAKKVKSELYNRPAVQSYLQRMAKLSEGQNIADDKQYHQHTDSDVGILQL